MVMVGGILGVSKVCGGRHSLNVARVVVCSGKRGTSSEVHRVGSRCENGTRGDDATTNDAISTDEILQKVSLGGNWDSSRVWSNEVN